jgi:hypothetical protein
MLVLHLAVIPLEGISVKLSMRAGLHDRLRIAARGNGFAQ